ncbi:transcription antitermination factor NusB [Breoghania sp. L-A4]|uniref:RsmB/NOP family class I SAM-dependent RNA methyltransferase n=1 Tax=Breoghania sp. L-A4 TaxID=2304600 RepID=UPI000E3609F7|nr:transcription antitermination factor NusB [Breoghania sp. L-A4]AXS42318.1 MFS transporter [Breoghania sp. L-A4]
MSVPDTTRRKNPTSEKRPQSARPEGVAGLACRRTAADILGNVVHRKATLTSELDPRTGHAVYRQLDVKDRALTRAIVSVALRRRGQIADVVARLVDRPIPEKTGRAEDILHVAIAQILFLEVADHAAVSLAVTHAGRDRKAQPYKGLINGVLRRLTREREEIVASQDETVLNTPEWMRERWEAAYGREKTREIARAHLSEAALDLTVKPGADGDSGAAAWAERYEGIVLPTGSVRLQLRGALEKLPGFSKGEWWVQDAAASLPATLLGDVSGLRVADLCAAPGGKTAQLAAAGAHVTAVDVSSARLKRLDANMKRLKLKVKTVVADLVGDPDAIERAAQEPDGISPVEPVKGKKKAGSSRVQPALWAPEEPFDAILLDAPCSATGTIRRHPDIPYLKRPRDIEALAVIQAALLDRVADWVKPGGLVVYCTCSLEPEEGAAQIDALLARSNAFERVAIAPDEVPGLEGAITDAGDLRTLPGGLPHETPQLSGIDGFFVARLRRKTV